MDQQPPPVTHNTLPWLSLPISNVFHVVIPSVHSQGWGCCASPCPKRGLLAQYI